MPLAIFYRNDREWRFGAICSSVESGKRYAEDGRLISTGENVVKWSENIDDDFEELRSMTFAKSVLGKIVLYGILEGTTVFRRGYFVISELDMV